MADLPYELSRGGELAEALVVHLCDMPMGPSSCMLPVRHEGKDYVVEVRLAKPDDPRVID